VKKIRKPEIHEAILTLFVLWQVVFVILKAVVVAWSWWIIALPLIIFISAALLFFIWGCLVMASVSDGEDYESR